MCSNTLVRSPGETYSNLIHLYRLRDTVKETKAKVDEPMEISTTTTTPTKPVVPENTLLPPNSKLIDDLLLPPGRHSRPIKLVVIMRGPPGSGKTYTAKLIKVCVVSKCTSTLLY